MHKRTVVEVVQHLRPGGLEHLALDLVEFASPHQETLVVSLEGTASVEGEQWDRAKKLSDKIIFLDKQPGLKPGLVPRLSKLFRELNADAVHTHHIGPLIYGGLAARIAGVRSIVHTEHNAWHLTNTKRRRVQALFLSLVRPKLVADADAVAKSLQRAFPASRPHVIRNGIDTKRFREGDKLSARDRIGLPHEPIIVGCAARLEPVKGHSVLIEALALLPSNIHLALAGDGSQREALRSQVMGSNLQDRIHFLGCLDDMENFYQSLDVFCLPSLNEGLPLAPLEAQSCGVKSVLTDVGACREAVAPSLGQIVPPRNPGELALAITSVIQLGSASPRYFIERFFDVRSMAQNYEELYA